MIVFEGGPGKVAFYTGAVQAGATIKPLIRTDPAIDFDSTRSIVTRVAMSQQTNHQFLHTLGNEIHIYVFGDRIGQMTISGLSFGPNCEGVNSNFGIEKMLEWYNVNKLSTRPDPVRVQIGNVPVRGFVASLDVDVVDPKTWVTQFNLQLMVIPPRTIPSVLVGLPITGPLPLTDPFDRSIIDPFGGGAVVV